MFHIVNMCNSLGSSFFYLQGSVGTMVPRYLQCNNDCYSQRHLQIDCNCYISYGYCMLEHAVTTNDPECSYKVEIKCTSHYVMNSYVRFDCQIYSWHH